MNAEESATGLKEKGLHSALSSQLPLIGIQIASNTRIVFCSGTGKSLITHASVAGRKMDSRYCIPAADLESRCVQENKHGSEESSHLPRNVIKTEARAECKRAQD